jgi:hypothetical protein
MNNSAEPGGLFVYFIPNPSLLRVILLAIAALFSLILFGIPLNDLGFTRILETINDDPSFLLMPFIMIAPVILSSLLLAFPPRSWLARLEFRRDCIRSIPRPVLRWIGEPSVEIPLSAHPKEILLCRGSKDNSPYGFRVLLRGANGHDREIKIETGERLNKREAAILTEGVTDATGLSARLVQRQHPAEGTIQEVQWIPTGGIAWLGAIAKLAFISLPIVGGAAVAYRSPSPIVIVAVGIALWLSQTLAVFIWANASQRQSKSAMLYWMTTLFTFGATYAATVALVSLMLHSR